MFPNVPTTLALCASTATSPGLGFSVGVNGTTVSQAALPSGTGRPGTAQLRNTKASTTGSSSTVFITDDVNGRWRQVDGPGVQPAVQHPGWYSGHQLHLRRRLTLLVEVASQTVCGVGLRAHPASTFWY